MSVSVSVSVCVCVWGGGGGRYPLDPPRGLQGYTLFFLFLLKNIDCGYALDPPRRDGSNEYHNLCFEQKYEEIQNSFI